MSSLQVIFKPKSLMAFFVTIGILLIISSFGSHYFDLWLEERLWTAGIILSLIGGIPWLIFITLSVFRNIR